MTRQPCIRRPDTRRPVSSVLGMALAAALALGLTACGEAPAEVPRGTPSTEPDRTRFADIVEAVSTLDLSGLGEASVDEANAWVGLDTETATYRLTAYEGTEAGPVSFCATSIETGTDAGTEGDPQVYLAAVFDPDSEGGARTIYVGDGDCPAPGAAAEETSVVVAEVTGAGKVKPAKGEGLLAWPFTEDSTG